MAEIIGKRDYVEHQETEVLYKHSEYHEEYVKQVNRKPKAVYPPFNYIPGMPPKWFNPDEMDND